MNKLLITLSLPMLIAVPLLAGDSTEVKVDSAGAQVEAKAEKVKKSVDSTVAEEEPKMQTTELGVQYLDLVVGKGNPAKMGSRAEVHYTLWLTDTTGVGKGKRLQSSKDKGQTYVCTLGQNLIAGWSDGMVGMQEGGVRMLHIPWKLAYGAQGRPPLIPAKSDLIFEIEYVSAK